MFRRFIFSYLVVFLQCYPFVVYAEEKILMEDISEEEWALIENWEILEHLDLLKEDLEVIEEQGEENHED